VGAKALSAVEAMSWPALLDDGARLRRLRANRVGRHLGHGSRHHPGRAGAPGRREVRACVARLVRLAAWAVLGGLLLGYGARIAYGCNIGAYFSGIASGSLHGWLWLVAAFIGNIAGTRLRPVFGLSR
jgi:uncharacterized membrane protein YedE/YeeE